MALGRLLPKGLFWRSVLIVVAPMIILQLFVAYLIVERHFDGVARQMTRSVAGELRYVRALVERAADPEEARRTLFQASASLGGTYRIQPEGVIPPNVDPIFFDVIAVAVEETLREELGEPLFVALDRSAKVVDVRTKTRFGVLRARLPRRRVVAANPHLLITWMLGAAAALIAVALLYLRNQVRPIQDLAAAADAFGKGRSKPLRVAGAREVRLASTAFLDARARIERHIEQRTRMLSGVSHDLRTPLTRMKLALEMAEGGPEIDELRHDLAEMEHILDEFLAYARGDQAETFREVDVSLLVREVVTEARRKHAAITFETRFESTEAATPAEALVGAGAAAPVSEVAPSAQPGRSVDALLAIRPLAIKRSLHNLIENAISYGDSCHVAFTATPEAIEITVEDNGPGIPPEEREAAFRPFHQLDPSRNRNRSGGVGLGLALALDAVRGHGGDIALDDSPRLGGLRATALLPR